MSLEQLTLPGIQIRDDATFTNFFINSTHSEIITVLKALTTTKESYFIYLWGASGSGKSHLLQAVCHEVWETKQNYIYLPCKKIPELNPTLLTDLNHLKLVCLDDIDVINQLPTAQKWEEALFNLYNNILQTGGSLIISAQNPPANLAFDLPDLTSRLHSGLTFHLPTLTDEDKQHALQTRAHQRGIELSQPCLNYLLNHYNRNMVELVNLLDRLDEVSLTTQRKITIPFIREYL